MATTNLFKRIRIGRALQATGSNTPVTYGLIAVLAVVQVSGMVLLLLGISTGDLLAVTLERLEHFEFWRLLTFAFSCFAPELGAGGSGTGIGLLASLLIFFFSVSAIFAGGMVTERRIGGSRMAVFILVTIALQAFFTLVIFANTKVPGGGGYNAAFSPIGVVMAILTMSLLIEFEGNDPRNEADLDFRLMVAGFTILLVAVAAAFNMHLKSLLVGLMTGPLIAIAAFATYRKAERDLVSRHGSGTAGGLFYADETDLMTARELRARTDELLDRIAATGRESLTKDEKRFLSSASQRLRRAKGLDDADKS